MDIEIYYKIWKVNEVGDNEVENLKERWMWGIERGERKKEGMKIF